MAHVHAHDGLLDEDVPVGWTARVSLLVSLALVGVATIVGLVAWWPDRSPDLGENAAFAAPGVTFPSGEVVEVGEPCAPDEMGAPGCNVLTVDVDGERVEVQAPPEVLQSGLDPGDGVELMRTPGDQGAYTYFATDRSSTLLWLGLAFVLVVLAIAWWRGLFALIGLAFGGFVVWKFMLPALLLGSPGVGIALVSASAIMFVVLYSTHGFSLRTSTALAGTLLGVWITAGLGVVAVSDARLTGIADESGAILGSIAGDFDFQALLGCALVIAGLGVLNDVTITQASAVWELRAASPSASRWRVFTSAMRIGRDHIASTIYTIVFAYVGTALLLLMLLRVYDRPLLDLLATEQLAEEVVRTFTTSIGLVLAVPITTALAALVAAPTAVESEV